MEKNKLNFITEIASTHNGDINIVRKIFKNHLKSKSDLIKFQLLNTDELYETNSKLNNKFKKLEIERLLIEKLILQYKKKTKIILEIFDEKSYDFAKKFTDKKISSINLKEIKNFPKDSSINIEKLLNLLKKNHINLKKIIF